MLIRAPSAIKLAGKKESINPMWKVINKEADSTAVSRLTKTRIETYRQGNKIDPKTEWKFWPSSSSSPSWWEGDNWDERHDYDS